jgi:Domain of unknown function (DUF4265)
MSTPNSERLAADTGRSNEITVLFYLYTGDDWPPYPGETVPARLLSPFLVEVTGAPRYAYGVSRGDEVAVTHDGLGFIGRHIKHFGGHATVRVVATTTAELKPIAQVLTAAGANVEFADETTMLAVDVPAGVDLAGIETILEAAVSMTCNYEIASDKNGAHR